MATFAAFPVDEAQLPVDPMAADDMGVLQTGLESPPSFAPPAAQEPRPVAERLPAETLHKMYMAWEQAKEGEILEQHTASRYYHSKQWTDSEIKALKRRKQPVTTKNRIKRKVDFLVGVEQRLRRDPKAFPRTPNGEKAAFVASACIRFVEDENKWPSIASECSSEAMIRGVGAQWAGVKVIAGKPEVRKLHVPSERFFYDPRSVKWDFSDSRYLGEHQWLDMDEAIELLPFAKQMIEALGESGNVGAMTSLPQEFEKEKNWHPWVDARQRRIRLISIWYKYKGQWMFDYLVGPVSLCPEGHDCLSPYNGEDEGTTDHPYRAWSPYVDERGDRYGVVRDMIPLQDGINKRSSKLLYMLTVRQTKGEVGAVADVDAMKQEMAKPDGHVEYNKGFEFDTIDHSQEIKGQFELLQEDKAEIENLGPNPGLIGRGVEKQSGRAILAQQNSGMTELSPVFERMREWKLACYRKDWQLMRQFWTNERYVRITGDPKAIEFLHINRVAEDPLTGQVHIENAIAEMDVDILLDEGPDTVTMREELMEQLSQMGPEAIPPELLIEMSNISEKDTILQKLKEFKAPPPEVIELQKKMADLEEKLAAANVDKAQADVESSRAGTLKTLVETGLPPQVVSEVFPFAYRVPSFLEQAAGQQNRMMDQAPMGMEGPENPMLIEGEDPMQAVADHDYQADFDTMGQPTMPDPRMMSEPQLNQPGGLPMGPV
jgi:hypothetical protein